MDIYFDSPNLLSFIRSAKKDKYGDCVRMLKDHFSLHFSFSKSDVESFCDDDKNDFYLWMRSMDSLKDEIKWGDRTFDAGFNPKLFGKDKDKLMSVYCLRNSQTYAKQGMVLIATLGEEVDTLASLFVEGNQFTANVYQEVKQWDDLLSYSSPVTDIIVVDPYIFFSPELNKPNIYTIIRTLCQRTPIQKINIVVFSLREYRDDKTKITYVPDWDTIYSEIRSCVKSKCRPNVTFVTLNKDVLKEHDRSIFTNYKVFSSGDTYNYFNSKGERVTDGRWLHVHSCASRSNKDDAEKLISDLQKKIDYVKNDLRNPNLILKDKECNFIDFEKPMLITCK